MTIFARNVDTGEVAWAYQMTPFDQWDYDGINENMLEDLNVDGKMRKVLIHFDRNGFAYVLDRTDGTLLRAQQVRHHQLGGKDRHEDWPSGEGVRAFAVAANGNTQACPSAMGGKDQQPCAIDPTEPGMAYCPTNNWCMEDEPQERSHTQQGTVYVFANVYMYPEKPGITGKFKKFNVLTGETVWEIPDPYPNWGGALVTDGGLAFYGDLLGNFRAVDRKTGKVLWERRLGSGIIGNPITYKVGRQAVRVGVEWHRWLDRTAGDGGSGSLRQVRRDRRDRDDQGCQPGQDPAGWHALHVPSRITIIGDCLVDTGARCLKGHRAPFFGEPRSCGGDARRRYRPAPMIERFAMRGSPKTIA